jgi:EAL domain-containing protein (putative c-di-GMP-specific phosphodiesterase class I)
VGYYVTAFTILILILEYVLAMFAAVAGKVQLMNTVFLIWECVTALLALTTHITGFLYRLEDGTFYLGVGEIVFFALRILALAGLLAAVWRYRSMLSPRLYQNLMAMLIFSVGLHILPLFLRNLHIFGVFAVVFFSAMLDLLHIGAYEEGSARMGMDLYRREMDYQLEKNREFYVMELQVRNYEQLIERRCFDERQLDELYCQVGLEMSRNGQRVMLFQKMPTRIGIITRNVSREEAERLAEQIRHCVTELYQGMLLFDIVAVHCPGYAADSMDVERLLWFLQKQSPANEVYFCGQEDYDEFCERSEILLLLHDMQLEKQDVVLYGRPIIERESSRVRHFEILCRLQLAGSGIVNSDHVIRLAETYGYIHRVNMAVLKNACDFLSSELARREHLGVSLHISSEELEKPEFARDVLEIIRDYDLQPESFGFEVTMVPGKCDVERMRQVMNVLRAYQIVFILTDFDPVAVNFESIAELPFSMIKFERHCVQHAMERAMSFDVIGMLVDLFKERGFTVAFKGIDNEELEETAISLGADFLQGEKYTKPFPIDEMTRQMELKALF